ncbi:bifunctional DNA-formamidopyrimidine glycosylase/DNA-(apurinic or apyrimidinic site) lyase [Allopusillimonas soli]|uniref:Formamidopyrimidine-DNA glycosylase n=1 Tax=Allopusillimonas soli TaxID=659016 RepID=A0A853F7C0_9BURK|nr:bifunctional DNA-formamidopyrimidine glycosylase/DNA-(apurinic or apyrimidinic site) lyase [Allopusillimonas soli]NYT35718.1 bifunctional DNA-formamidopyrimidine glycosylase/DNA-(apurinic or apyrimidinic site) lyase [Allopusillimonas soli]TEA76107.1 bifunctional DNA-formamidopyrimidine glycosylase/DNA-(apurinic or apyrimidinic site) lyase [Allopusillimonas soli]
MPELPEVETTRRGIATIMPGQVLEAFIVHEPRMRWPVPPDMAAKMAGQRVLSCGRRGKYLLIEFAAGTQIVHLGMSGSLRRVASDAPRLRHDHAEWVFAHARFLLHDPRRFGAILWHDAADGPIQDHPLLARLGLEPFDPGFTPDYLHAALRGRRQAIKQVLLGGNIVVGAGNIYASEALFKAGISPRASAGSLSRPRCAALVAALRETLTQALESGGSTLRDYVDASGQPGAYFALHAAVYEKAGSPCPACGTPIRRIVQGQRATYYCPRCQRR